MFSFLLIILLHFLLLASPTASERLAIGVSQSVDPACNPPCSSTCVLANNAADSASLVQSDPNIQIVMIPSDCPVPPSRAAVAAKPAAMLDAQVSPQGQSATPTTDAAMPGQGAANAATNPTAGPDTVNGMNQAQAVDQPASSDPPCSSACPAKLMAMAIKPAVMLNAKRSSPGQAATPTTDAVMPGQGAANAATNPTASPDTVNRLKQAQAVDQPAPSVTPAVPAAGQTDLGNPGNNAAGGTTVAVPEGRPAVAVQPAERLKGQENAVQAAPDPTTAPSAQGAAVQQNAQAVSPNANQAPAPVTPASVTPASVTPASVTPASVTPASVTPASVTPAPVVPAPVVPAPVTPASVTPASVTRVPPPMPALAKPAAILNAQSQGAGQQNGQAVGASANQAAPAPTSSMQAVSQPAPNGQAVAAQPAATLPGQAQRVGQQNAQVANPNVVPAPTLGTPVIPPQAQQTQGQQAQGQQAQGQQAQGQQAQGQQAQGQQAQGQQGQGQQAQGQQAQGQQAQGQQAQGQQAQGQQAQGQQAQGQQQQAQSTPNQQSPNNQKQDQQAQDQQNQNQPAQTQQTTEQDEAQPAQTQQSTEQVNNQQQSQQQNGQQQNGQQSQNQQAQAQQSTSGQAGGQQTGQQQGQQAQNGANARSQTQANTAGGIPQTTPAGAGPTSQSTPGVTSGEGEAQKGPSIGDSVLNGLSPGPNPSNPGASTLASDLASTTQPSPGPNLPSITATSLQTYISASQTLISTHQNIQQNPSSNTANTGATPIQSLTNPVNEQSTTAINLATYTSGSQTLVSTQTHINPIESVAAAAPSITTTSLSTYTSAGSTFVSTHTQLLPNPSAPAAQSNNSTQSQSPNEQAVAAKPAASLITHRSTYVSGSQTLVAIQTSLSSYLLTTAPIPTSEITASVPGASQQSPATVVVDGSTRIISGSGVATQASSTPTTAVVEYSNIETVGGKPTTLVQTTRGGDVAGNVTLSANPGARTSSGNVGGGGGGGGGSATTTKPAGFASGASISWGGLGAVKMALEIAVGVGVMMWMS